jgi:hypothetical protein
MAACVSGSGTSGAEESSAIAATSSAALRPSMAANAAMKSTNSAKQFDSNSATGPLHHAMRHAPSASPIAYVFADGGSTIPARAPAAPATATSRRASPRANARIADRPYDCDASACGHFNAKTCLLDLVRNLVYICTRRRTKGGHVDESHRAD